MMEEDEAQLADLPASSPPRTSPLRGPTKDSNSEEFSCFDAAGTDDMEVRNSRKEDGLAMTPGAAKRPSLLTVRHSRRTFRF